MGKRNIFETMSAAAQQYVKYTFGQYRVSCREFFFRSRSGITLALVNQKPVVPGHLLVIPERRVSRMDELTDAELADLWLSAREIGKLAQRHWSDATSLTFAVQDGPEAGQTVDHVHVHVMPRRKGDFERNDEIYDKLEIEDEKRKARTLDEMAVEADALRALLPDELQLHPSFE